MMEPVLVSPSWPAKTRPNQLRAPDVPSLTPSDQLPPRPVENRFRDRRSVPLKPSKLALSSTSSGGGSSVLRSKDGKFRFKANEDECVSGKKKQRQKDQIAEILATPRRQLQLRMECLQICDIIDAVVLMEKGSEWSQPHEWRLAQQAIELARRAIQRDSHFSMNEREWCARLQTLRLVKKRMFWFAERRRELSNQGWLAVSKISDPVEGDVVHRFTWANRLSYPIGMSDSEARDHGLDPFGTPLGTQTPTNAEETRLIDPGLSAQLASIEKCLAWMQLPLGGEMQSPFNGSGSMTPPAIRPLSSLSGSNSALGLF